MTDQLIRLSRPFPGKYISQVPSGGGSNDYVAHSTVTEALLAIVGPYSWSVSCFRNKDGAIAGAVGTLRCEIDGREVTVEGIGATNGSEKHEGDAAKNAESDAFKRAAMRLGLGLHLWSGSSYFLHENLIKQAEKNAPTAAVSA